MLHSLVLSLRLTSAAGPLLVKPDEMGIGPVFAIPKLLEATGLTMNDIDLVELNEASLLSVCTAETSWKLIQRSTT